MRGDQQIVRADGPTALHQHVPDLAILLPRIPVERQDVEVELECVELSSVLRDPGRMRDAVAQLRVRDRRDAYPAGVRLEAFPSDANVGVRVKPMRVLSGPVT